MADSSQSAAGDTSAGTPRWVKVSAAIAVVLVLLVGVMLLTGHGPGRHLGGDHGPNRHQPAGESDGGASSVPEGHKPPPGAPDHGVE